MTQGEVARGEVVRGLGSLGRIREASGRRRRRGKRKMRRGRLRNKGLFPTDKEILPNFQIL